MGRMERGKLEAQIAALEAELEEAKRAEAHMIKRMDLLRENRAPEKILMRYKLDLMDQSARINALNAKIWGLRNQLEDADERMDAEP